MAVITDNRPIGLLDSGVGGLTVVRQLFCQLPNEEVVYIGDTARMPYGPRPDEEILQYTWEMVNFLLSKNVKMIVFACNTATVVALEQIREKVNIPILGVVSAGVTSALEKTKQGKIGVIATQATIHSESYAKALYAGKADLEVHNLACPDFVTLVESGDFENEASQKLIQENLNSLVGKIDTLILGCTHFPLLRPQIQTAVGEEVELVDSGAETIKDLSVLLEEKQLRAEPRQSLKHQFFTTGKTEDFKKIAENWLEREISVESIDISQEVSHKLLIATKNKGKVREFKEAFAQIDYEIESLLDHPELPDIEETGSTFEENARLKAETISKLTGKVVIADDSGLCVDILGGAPGVWSHRFSGPDPTDAENNAKLLHELASTITRPKLRTAHFHTTLVAASPDRESLVVEADWQGRIALESQGKDGFGYDPLFLIADSDRSAAELTTEEKNEISHRGQALKKLLQQFPDWLS